MVFCTWTVSKNSRDPDGSTKTSKTLMIIHGRTPLQLKKKKRIKFVFQPFQIEMILVRLRQS